MSVVEHVLYCCQWWIMSFTVVCGGACPLLLSPVEHVLYCCLWWSMSFSVVSGGACPSLLSVVLYCCLRWSMSFTIVTSGACPLLLFSRQPRSTAMTVCDTLTLSIITIIISVYRRRSLFILYLVVPKPQDFPKGCPV